MNSTMAKKLIIKQFSNGNVQYICPHCKKVIFEGFYMGITIHDIEGKCPYCNKEVDDSIFGFKELKKNA